MPSALPRRAKRRIRLRPLGDDEDGNAVSPYAKLRSPLVRIISRERSPECRKARGTAWPRSDPEAVKVPGGHGVCGVGNRDGSVEPIGDIRPGEAGGGAAVHPRHDRGARLNRDGLACRQAREDTGIDFLEDEAKAEAR